MANPEKKKPSEPPGQSGGGPPGQSGKPPKPVQTAVRAAVSAVGVAAVDIQLTLAPPVEPPPAGVRHDVAVAATARGRVMAQTVVMPAVPIAPGETATVTLTWAAIDPATVPFGSTYTGYRVALQGPVSPPEQFVPLGTLTASFPGMPAGDYVGQCQLSTADAVRAADVRGVDTTVVREGDVHVAGLPVTVALT